jgi:serine/threonine protein kinase
MPRLQQFVECLGAALCEYATAALARLVPFETALLEVARAMHRHTTAILPPPDLRAALREVVSSPVETVELAIQDGVSAIRPPVAEEFRDSLVAYLELLPEVVRQALRRPGDPDGVSVPEQFAVRRAEDWLLFLPDRLPIFRPGDLPPGLDNWRVESLRGLGPHAEVWDGYDDDQPELSPACLKFVTDPKALNQFDKQVAMLRRVLDLEVVNGLIPLRSAYVLTSPPCLEYVLLPGYDLANLMHDARWKGDRPRPDQAALLARRTARIVGKLHRLNPPLVHRGLKPSNVLLCPTNEGRVSAWVSDTGWGQITAAVGADGLDVSQAIRRSLRGSYGPLYASPQQRAGGLPDPRDDVYAIGVIWYQLLMRDPTAKPPADPNWAAEFRRHGLSDSLAGLLTACLSEVPADRPGDGQTLADLIAANTTPVRNGDSATIRLRGSTSHDVHRPREPEPDREVEVPRLRVKPKLLEEDEEED